MDQLLGLVTALLLLAVVVAVLGIMNTLALSVVERTRELGLLRAVGATRHQVAGVIRDESVLMALLGPVTGLALGTGAGVAMSRALVDEGISTVTLPATLLATYLVVAIIVGILAAIGPPGGQPGRRADGHHRGVTRHRSSPIPLPLTGGHRASRSAWLDLYWLPLGADGSRVVRACGRAYEWLSARRSGRARRALYHSALKVHMDGVTYVIEVAPVWSRSTPIAASLPRAP